MATLLSNQSAVARNPVIQPKGTSTVSFNTSSYKYFFYTDNPEAVTTACLADNGKWLNRASVNGNGQVYTWHQNKTGSTINMCLLIYNPNTYGITLNVTNYGTTRSSSVIPDSAAWANYMAGQSTSTTVAAGGYGTLFLASVPNNYVYGILARINITNSSTGASASATFYDLAYISNSGGATAAAPVSGSTVRGKAPSHYTTINFAALTPPTGVNGVGYTIGAAYDTFSGSDMAYVTDESGQASGSILGCYGQQIIVNLPITNTTGTARNFRIFIGTQASPGKAFPFASIGGSSITYTSGINAGLVRDVIDTGTIANNSTTTVSFTTAVPAVSSTAYIIGVRAV
jgi:hypothetical protein